MFNFGFGLDVYFYEDLIEMRGKCCMLVRIVLHLGKLDELLVSEVRAMMRVFLQMYKDFLEMENGQMIGVG